MSPQLPLYGGLMRMRRFYRADRRLYMLLHARARTGRLDSLMVAATRSGTKGMIWIAIAALLFAFGDRELRIYSLAGVAALLIAEGAINLVLKPAIRRERPYVRNRLSALLVKAPGPNSWPSAHAGSSMAAGLVLATGTGVWGIVFIALAFLIGYSRVYVGVHYPADIIAGFVIGIIAAAITLLVAVHV